MRSDVLFEMEIWRLLRHTARILGGRVRSERGATAVEYGLMITFVAALIITAVVFLGSTAQHTFDCAGRALPRGAQPAGC